MASIRERIDSSGKARWHAQVRLLGFEPQTKTFDRKTDAKAWADETERLMKLGRFNLVSEGSHRTVSDLFATFRRDYMRETRNKDYTQILGWWEARLGRLHLANIRGTTIQKLVTELATEPIPTISKSEKDELRFRTSSTVIRYLAVLSRVMTVAVRNLEWLERSPMAGVKRPVEGITKIVRTLSMDEETRLISAARQSSNPYIRTIILVALRTGMRYSEIMHLRWRDLEIKEGFAMVIVRKPKNKRQRVVPLVRDALASVLELLPADDRKPDALLFPSAAFADKPVEIRQAWETCLKRADIQKFRFHDLRHSAASRFASSGHSLAEIAEMLGHTDLRSTQIYTHFDKSHMIRMAQRAADASIQTAATPSM